MTILIVDDSKVVRHHVHTVLDRAGYGDVVEAASANEAFALLGVADRTDLSDPGAPGNPGDVEAPGAARNPALPVDLVLLDVVMPEVDGVEACRRIKTAEALSDVPVIMVTGQDDPGQLVAAFAAGAMDYITKPARDVELLARVRSALRLKHETDQRKAREVELVQMTTQLEAANQRLERLSSLDGLTGIANRRRLNEYLELSREEALRTGRPLSVLLMDIDHFKLFNDTYGHQGGDDCLKQVASAVAACATRETDLAARYGGEEFAVILPNTPTGRAVVLAEMVRARVRALNIRHERNSAADRVTVSIGVATLALDGGEEAASLVQRADEALYEAKHAGRNRLHIASERALAAAA